MSHMSVQKILGVESMAVDNLNDLFIQADSRLWNLADSADRLRDYSVASSGIQVYFRNLEEKLIGHIKEADAIVGCVAWLTSEPILEALAGKRTAIVVQKEDFLRPDSTSKGDWSNRLRKLYSQLHGGDRFDYGETILSSLSVCGDPTLEGVRCVGNYNRSKAPASPRSHHKFVVFCKAVSHQEAGEEIGDDYEWEETIPYAIWTGSFNFTFNATQSFENALYISDPAIAQAYYREWAQIEAISEPLDWKHDWVDPEWRIGT